MIRLRMLTRFSGGPPPDTSSSLRSSPRGRPRGMRKRLVTLLGLTTASSLCVFAACALCVPGLVFGSEAKGQSPNAAAAANRRLPVSTSVGTPLVTLPWGSGEGEVGLVRPVEGLTRGPEALAIAPDGRIAVLDSVNHRVLYLSADGQSAGAAVVSLSEPRFLAVDDQRLYVLDCDADRQVVTLDWNGVALEAVALPELPEVVTGLFATPEGPCVEVAHDSAFLVIAPAQATAADDLDEAPAPHGAGLKRGSLRPLAGRPVGPGLDRVAKITFTPTEKTRIRFFNVDRGTFKATQTADFRPLLASGHALEHLVSVDGDGRGGLVVGARLLDPGPPEDRQASLVLTWLAASGSGVAVVAGSAAAGSASNTIFLAYSSFAYLGQPYVVAPDGRIFQPAGSDAGYTIVVYSFAEGDTSATAEGAQP